MKKILLASLVLILGTAQTQAVTYSQKTVLGHLTKTLEYPIGDNDYELKFVKADEQTELSQILYENNGITWVNGVFFCPKDYGWCNTTVGYTDNERYIDGQKYGTYLTTWDRAVFGWNKDKKPFIYQSGLINYDDEDKIYNGFANYPLILLEWKSRLDYYHEAGLIDAKMIKKWTRNFVCSNQEKDTITFGFVYDATMDEMPDILLSMNCYDALSLDAGLSTAFMLNSRYIVGPWRDVMDALILERKWLSVTEIHSDAKKLSDAIMKIILEKSKDKPEKTLKYLEYVLKQIKDLRTEVYEKYSKDLYEMNIVGEMENVGYSIEINSLKLTKAINIINVVEIHLQSQADEIKKTLEPKVSETATGMTNTGNILPIPATQTQSGSENTGSGSLGDEEPSF